jgi:hypothetical protein
MTWQKGEKLTTLGKLNWFQPTNLHLKKSPNLTIVMRNYFQSYMPFATKNYLITLNNLHVT